MRSGLIAQKVGMTRIFTDAGEHIPVTVLKVDGCQVVAHRTEETNGYTALQLGVGSRKPANVAKAERQHFAVADWHPDDLIAVRRSTSDPDFAFEVDNTTQDDGAMANYRVR